MLYREMGLSHKIGQMSLSEIPLLLTHNGTPIKRPFLLGNTLGLTGFNEAKWSEKLKASL